MNNDMDQVDADALVAQLWPNGDSLDGMQIYMVLDAARDPRIHPMVLSTGLEHCCLFAGPLSPALSQAAPHLVHLAPKVRFTQEVLRLGWGQSWGILAVARPDVTLPVLRRHFRSLLRVSVEGGGSLHFRFYDPRVLRLYMRTCESADTLRIVGPADQLICESEDAGSLQRYAAPQGTCSAGSGRLPLAVRRSLMRRLERAKLVEAAVEHLEYHWPLPDEPPPADWVEGAVDEARMLEITDTVITLRFVAIAALYRASGKAWPDACARAILCEASIGSPEERLDCAARHEELQTLVEAGPIAQYPAETSGVFP
jgi:hypothetical protein